MNTKDKIRAAVNKLDIWIENNGWAGYDPYDVKENRMVRKITDWGNRFFLAEVVREGLFELFLMFPKTTRRLLAVRPDINAKAMGLMANAYNTLYTIYKENKYEVKCKDCISWLNNNYSKDFPGKGWGYPFNWQAKELIPRNTPNGIVTTAVAAAYWNLYERTQDVKYLDVCKDSCRFLVSLPIDHVSDNQICFSYTSVFVNHIHNLNLFVAEMLIKVGREIGENKWITLGENAVNYTIEHQSDDGSFDYNGPPDPPKELRDNYHTAFVLRMLYSIWKITKNDKYYSSLKKCYNYYINNFFENRIIPKFTPDRLYRIDIHSSAEAINCLCELSPDFPDGVDIALNVALWTIDNLQDNRGYFYHGIFMSRIIRRPFISKIAHMRWGQAWMLLGLSNLLKVLERRS